RIRLPDLPDRKNSIALMGAFSLNAGWGGGDLSPAPAYGGNKNEDLKQAAGSQAGSRPLGYELSAGRDRHHLTFRSLRHRNAAAGNGRRILVCTHFSLRRRHR